MDSLIWGVAVKGGMRVSVKSTSYRKETDLLGDREVPAEAYWGIQTLRASENFSVSGVRLYEYPTLIKALAMVKKACVLANKELGTLNETYADAISQTCDEIIQGRHNGQFIVDAFQGGAGTSTNMNMNEVIASRANELIGESRNTMAPINANDHVNMSQSTNDVYPTAVKIAMIYGLRDLSQSLQELIAALDMKAGEFKSLLKLGRTEMQDAVPITLGQEFSAWSGSLKRDTQRSASAIGALRTHNIGATAIGTGLNAEPEYIVLAGEHIREVTGLQLTTSDNLVDYTQNYDEFVYVSHILSVLSTNLIKICGDLLLLSSGPIGGFHEITLPAMQPGSSIMPGKVNPVIVEMMIQCCYQSIANDTAISLAAQGGQLELNAFGPLIAYNFFQALRLLRNGIQIFAEKCIAGIKPNIDGLEVVHKSVGLVTALNPIIGYKAASRIATKALETRRPIRELVLEEGLVSEEQLDQILSLQNMTHPGIAGRKRATRSH